MNNITAVKEWAGALIASVAPALAVYTHERVIVNREELVEDFGTGAADPDDDNYEQTRGWMVTVDAAQPNRAEAFVAYSVRLMYFHSLHTRGASESDFETHLAAVAEAFRADGGATLDDALDIGPLFAEALELVEWPTIGGRLHHRATITFPVHVTEIVR